MKLEFDAHEQEQVLEAVKAFAAFAQNKSMCTVLSSALHIFTGTIVGVVKFGDLTKEDFLGVVVDCLENIMANAAEAGSDGYGVVTKAQIFEVLQTRMYKTDWPDARPWQM